MFLSRWRCSLCIGVILLIANVVGCDASPGAQSKDLQDESEANRSSPAVSKVPVPGSSAAEGRARTPQRVYSTAPRAWILAEPRSTAQRLGYLRVAASAPVQGELIQGPGCKSGWMEIEPRGFICIGKRATLNADTPLIRLFSPYEPELNRGLPYRYGIVRNPGPIYSRLPTEEETAKVEPGHAERMQRWLGAKGEIGAGYRQRLWVRGKQRFVEPALAWQNGLSSRIPAALDAKAAVPAFFGKPPLARLVVGRMPPRAGFAVVDTFISEGRRFGLTTRATLVPTDRLRPIRGSTFEGYKIGTDVQFPFAIVRSVNAEFRNGAAATYRSSLPLTGKQRFFGKVLHYVTA